MWSEESKKQAKEIILTDVAAGKSLAAIIRERDRTEVPEYALVMKWRREDQEFEKNYAEARITRTEFYFDQILEIAHTQEEGTTIETKSDGSVKVSTGDMLGHRRLKIDAIKWHLSKMDPKRFGDKIDHTTDGEKITQINVGFAKPTD